MFEYDELGVERDRQQSKSVSLLQTLVVVSRQGNTRQPCSRMHNRHLRFVSVLQFYFSPGNVILLFHISDTTSGKHHYLDTWLLMYFSARCRTIKLNGEVKQCLMQNLVLRYYMFLIPT